MRSSISRECVRTRGAAISWPSAPRRSARWSRGCSPRAEDATASRASAGAPRHGDTAPAWTLSEPDTLLAMWLSNHDVDERVPPPDEWQRSGLRAPSRVARKQASPVLQHYAITRVRLRIDTRRLSGRLRDFRTGRKTQLDPPRKRFEHRAVSSKPRYSGENCDDRATWIVYVASAGQVPIRIVRVKRAFAGIRRDRYA